MEPELCQPCSPCCCSGGDDSDGWDGLQFCRARNAYAGGSAAPRRHAPLTAATCAADQLNVVGQGLKRFEIGKTAPVQPRYEQISPAVWSVLGQNPSPFTLNGTTGSTR
jgi:hypothetical protein